MDYPFFFTGIIYSNKYEFFLDGLVGWFFYLYFLVMTRQLYPWEDQIVGSLYMRSVSGPLYNVSKCGTGNAWLTEWVILSNARGQETAFDRNLKNAISQVMKPGEIDWDSCQWSTQWHKQLWSGDAWLGQFVTWVIAVADCELIVPCSRMLMGPWHSCKCFHSNRFFRLDDCIACLFLSLAPGGLRLLCLRAVYNPSFGIQMRRTTWCVTRGGPRVLFLK